MADYYLHGYERKKNRPAIKAIRIDGIISERQIYIDGELLNPERSLKVFSHSSEGFNWGYAGAGPAQLALAILLKFFDRATAIRYHEDFKWEVIVKLPPQNFTKVLDIGRWMQEKQKRR